MRSSINEGFSFNQRDCEGGGGGGDDTGNTPSFSTKIIIWVLNNNKKKNYSWCTITKETKNNNNYVPETERGKFKHIARPKIIIKSMHITIQWLLYSLSLIPYYPYIQTCLGFFFLVISYNHVFPCILNSFSFFLVNTII